MADSESQERIVRKRMWPSFETAVRLYDIANVSLVCALAIGVIATFLVVWMGSVKEEYLRRDLANTDVRAQEARAAAAVANSEAAKANEGAAKANERAAQANKKAEEERLARIKIEEQLAPRTLSDFDRIAISKELGPFASHFSGRKIKVSSYSQDADGIHFALMIQDILVRAGIGTESTIGRTIPVGPAVNIGVKVTGPAKDKAFIEKLLNGLGSRIKTELNGEWNNKYAELSIDVGVKPVAGLPDIVYTDKKSK